MRSDLSFLTADVMVARGSGDSMLKLLPNACRARCCGPALADGSARARVASSIAAIVLAVLAGGCATADPVPGRLHVDAETRRRAGHGIRAEPGAPSVPADVSLDDGVTRDEAVAVALWNSPSFEASLADLGLARADLVEARLFRNPVLALLFPVGPKQLEWTLQLPIEALWQRPRRIAAATSNAQVVAERLVAEALSLIADVRVLHVEGIAGERRVALAGENASLTRRIADIADARLRAGDISELEARAARSDAAQAEAAFRALEHERALAIVALVGRMGLDTRLDRVALVADDVAPSLEQCGALEGLVTEALASRPDVRAAEIAVEAAGRRASWERSRIVNLMVVLDANGQGREGFEMGPGVNTELPLFARNQGSLSRAAAELERASRAYLATRFAVTAEVRTAVIRFEQARQARQIWANEIVPALQSELGQVELAYKSGEVPLIALLDVSRRLVQARIRELETGVALQKAGVGVDRAVGRVCAGASPRGGLGG